MNADGTSADVGSLPLDQLRRERAELQRVDDVVSYVRRVAQARIDIVRAEGARRAESSPTSGASLVGSSGDSGDSDGPTGDAVPATSPGSSPDSSHERQRGDAADHHEVDHVAADHETHDNGADDDESGGVPRELRAVLSKHLTGGASRPPRPVDGIDDHPLVDELDAVAAEHGFSRLRQLDQPGLGALDDALTVFEQRVSADRRVRHERLDTLSSELVRRYRDGEASLDHLVDGTGS